MVKLRIGKGRCTYLHDTHDAVHFHHVLPQTTPAKKGFALSLFLFIASANALYIFLVNKDSSVVIAFWSLLLSGFLLRLLSRKSVKKESVIIMPAFGVQLETHYSSGRTFCRFISIDRILKPLLLECVTPITCYWSLSLILRDEEELVLVFKELRPPVKMLIPIWKALCAATDTCKGEDVFVEDS